MKKEQLTKEELTSLLKEAEKAHTEYEYALCHKDEDWTTWYAEFIINRLQEESSMQHGIPSHSVKGDRRWPT